MASRALVLQGGGPLGAYEAGAYSVLYERISKQIKDNENVFDIIAGTSIGAINAAIIVSHVVKNRRAHPSWSMLKCWEESDKKLEKFWKEHMSSDPNLRWTLYYSMWRDEREREEWRHTYPKIATREAARKYYSAKEFLRKGARNVFTHERQFPIYDEKFFDNNRVDDIHNLWFRYSNYPLKESVKAYTNFPIETHPDTNEPRLLLVTVDIEEGETVTFDSYSKKSEYGDYNEQKREYKHTINYDQGLMVEHILASASIPLLYDYQRVPKVYDYTKAARGQEQDSSSENSRPFWDGALLSNTPTRELISHHKLFWEHNTRPTASRKTVYQMRTEQDSRKREEYAGELFELLWKEMRKAAATTGTTEAGITETQQEGSKLKVPDLDVYIVNLWPTKEEPFIQNNDYDLTKDRMFDIINHDKTSYDLKVAKFVTDYIELTRNLIQQLSKVGGNKEVVRKILLDDSKTESKFREGMPRKYLDLLIGRFNVNEKLKLEPKEDAEVTISNKWADWSSMTISGLLGQGKRDAWTKLTRGS